MRFDRILACSLLAAAATLQAQDTQPPAEWQDALDWLDGEAARFAADLEKAHEVLEARAEREDRALLARLSSAPPQPIARGYGILPELKPDVPHQNVQLQSRRYSLEQLTVDFMIDLREASLLARRATGDPKAPLATLIDNLERARARLRFMEAQIAYHRQWQQSVLDYAEYFAKQNEILVQARQLQELIGRGADAAEAGAVRAAILDAVAPFQPTPGLAITRRGTELVLRVQVHTDVHEVTFLDAFRQAVATEFNACSAARDARFSIDLEMVHVDRTTLYPNGAPDHGEPIDLADHIARFPEGALVLTSGAQTTYADVGKAMVFGAEPTSPRVLAHEFGHLLGFRDAYLRAYEGTPGSRFGVTLVEWTGLRNDLMGAPGRGRVTTEMIAEIITAYGDQ